ncbi:hypothetical protein JCM1841_003274 [Sporobolomyces salmonicolor]
MRPLGNYERYSLCRTNTGNAPIVVFTAVLPSTPSPAVLVRSRLLNAISQLLVRYPLLNCSVADPHTSHPCFRLRDDLTADQIVEERAAEEWLTAEDALLQGIEAGQGLDLEAGPLWKLWLGGKDDGSERRLVLIVSHIVSDGSGVRNLFAELLSLLHPAATPPAPDSTTGGFPPTLESTVDLRPSTLHLVRTVFSQLIVPRLPFFIRPKAPSIWPNPPLCPPCDQPTALKSLTLPTFVARGLSTTSKSHSVSTLHPLLYTAALSAIACSVSPSSSAPFQLLGLTPISLRSPAVDHPSATGNYVSSAEQLHSLLSPSTTFFWPLCRSYAAHLALPSTRQAAKEAMGMLAYIPNGDASVRDERPGRVLKQRTGWEQWLEEGMRKDEPWNGSFEVSNLARLPSTGWEAEGLKGVCWAQTGSASGAGLQLNAVSAGGDLAITVTWRKGTIDEGAVDRIWATYEQLLRRLAVDDVAEEATLADLVSLRN